ncbi:MAG TPA: universal stress protein [Longimicrobiales bacterium]|nr:universal stress protein [Longimicrobiales bacterium]
MRRILVPLDGSPLARWALPWALALRAAFDADLELVGVHAPLDVDLGPSVEGTWDADVRAAERAGLDAEATRLAEAGHPRPQTALVEGVPGPAIVARAARDDVDLIVVATHGRGGLSRAWLGSVASFIGRHAECPVLVLHPVDDGSEPDLRDLPLIDTILTPVDGSEFSEAAVASAAEIVDAFGASLVLLRAVPVPLIVGSPYIPHAAQTYAEERDARVAGAEAYLRECADRSGVDAPVRTVVVETEPAHAIPAAAGEEGADLIVMATHGRGALMRAIVGSVADKVMRTAPVPVLLVRPGRAAEKAPGVQLEERVPMPAPGPA